jgi:hypothetical protein
VLRLATVGPRPHIVLDAGVIPALACMFTHVNKIHERPSRISTTPMPSMSPDIGPSRAWPYVQHLKGGKRVSILGVNRTS